MGGHGGLNILPQKRWNVYNFDNREKVRKDEEAAAREDQLKREQSRRQDFEFRLQTLRHARNPSSVPSPNPNPSSSSSSDHINLFEGLAGFSALGSCTGGEKEDAKVEGGDDGGRKKKRMRKEEGKVKEEMTAEDEKYKLGYGLMGKGVKAPWYLSMSMGFDGDDEGEKGLKKSGGDAKKGSGGKKSIEELREERMRRERKEKERERELVRGSRRATGKGSSR